MFSRPERAKKFSIAFRIVFRILFRVFQTVFRIDFKIFFRGQNSFCTRAALTHSQLYRCKPQVHSGLQPGLQVIKLAGAVALKLPVDPT